MSEFQKGKGVPFCAYSLPKANLAKSVNYFFEFPENKFRKIKFSKVEL